MLYDAAIDRQPMADAVTFLEKNLKIVRVLVSTIASAFVANEVGDGAQRNGCLEF
jgi:hypothetical protein